MRGRDWPAGGAIVTGGGTKNRWLQSELARGKLEGLRLVAPREMVRFDALQPGRVPSTANFNQRDRARQRGPEACKAVLQSLLRNIKWSQEEAVLFVEWHPGNCSDWTRAARELQTESLRVQGSSLPNAPGHVWRPWPC